MKYNFQQSYIFIFKQSSVFRKNDNRYFLKKVGYYLNNVGYYFYDNLCGEKIVGQAALGAC